MGEIKTITAYPRAFRFVQGSLKELLPVANSLHPVDNQSYAAFNAISQNGIAEWYMFNLAALPKNAIVHAVTVAVRVHESRNGNIITQYYLSAVIDGESGPEIMPVGYNTGSISFSESRVREMKGPTGDYTWAQARDLRVKMRWSAMTGGDGGFAVFGMTATVTYELPPTEYAVVGGILRPVNAKFTGGGVLTEIVSQKAVIGGVMR